MAEIQNIKNRLLLYLKSQNIRKTHFEQKCGLSNGYINSIVNSISPAKLEVISKNYPDLNIGWLMSGDGTMLKVDATAQSVAEVHEPPFQYGQSISGSNNHNNMNTTDNSVIDALVAQLKEKDAQIDRLLKIIEKMQ